jgi:hypothetical protein
MVAFMIRHAVDSSFKNGKVRIPAPRSRDRASAASVEYRRNQRTKPPRRPFTSTVTATSNAAMAKRRLERSAPASSRGCATRGSASSSGTPSTAASKRYRRDASRKGRRAGDERPASYAARVWASSHVPTVLTLRFSEIIPIRARAGVRPRSNPTPSPAHTKRAPPRRWDRALWRQVFLT